MRTVAHLLSIVLHPLFMPLYTLLLAFRLDPNLSFFLPEEVRLITFAMVFLMTVLFPLLSTVLLLRAGVIQQLSMPTRQERITPFVMTLFYYGLTYYLLRRTLHHPATYAMLLGAVLALAITAVITLRWKISAHMVGMGGLLGALSALLVLHHTFAPLEMAAFILLAGALGTSRLIAGAHSPAQVYAGTVLGFTCTFVCVMAVPG